MAECEMTVAVVLRSGIRSVLFGLWNWAAVEIVDHFEYNDYYNSYF